MKTKLLLIIFFVTVFGSPLKTASSEKIWTAAEADRIKFTYFALINTYETHSHNLGEDTNNKVYVKKDGHVEAVYDEAGNLVTDCLNKGSYNYYPAHTLPLKHFTMDILPWIKLGNCPDDPSTKKERAAAFSKDFTDGVFRIIVNWDKVAKEEFSLSMVSDKEQQEALQIFLKISNSKPLKAFRFDGSDPWMTDQSQYDTFYKDFKQSIVFALGN